MEKNDLTEISGFNHLLEYYNTHKNTHWKEWLDFDDTFCKHGKQGLVGLFNPKKNKKEFKFVFKISQYINYLVQHEYTIMKGLNELAPYCPHFCKAFGTILCEVDPKVRKTGNPFEIISKYPIEKEVLLTEYIDNSSNFYNYIKSDKIHDDVIYSSVKQVLIAIAIAQKKKKFTHYDLHSFNILMKKCNKDLVFLYVLDDENQFCVPTHGHYPVIIDFGFSYIEDLEDNPAWPSMAHTDVGFMSDRYDPVADPKLFLVTVSREVKNKRNNKKATIFRNIVKNIFRSLTIDWDCGWDKKTKKGATDFVLEMLSPYNKDSNLFDNYNHYCIDLIQSLIILPLQEQKYDNIDKSYTTFLKEFIKIENEIGNPFYNLYILKGIVDVAREVRVDYLHSKSRDSAIGYFRRSVFERINCVSKYCNPKNIHFEKMLCSLLCLSKNIEGIMYDVIETRMKEKQAEYDKMHLQSIEQIYGAIEANIPTKYKFNKDTTVFVMNSITQSCSRMKLTPEICKEVNDIHQLQKGSFLYSVTQR
jgi:hypothetical protein